MRILTPLLAIALTGCGPGLAFNESQQMTSDQMLDRADHIFIGVIEDQEPEFWLFLRLPGQDSSRWCISRRRVRLENVLRGIEPAKTINIYEFFWMGATSGDWNSTGDRERDLFLTRVENGRYHVVRDWWRSIFPIYSGKHDRLPLDDSHTFWERVALLDWWIAEGHTHGRLWRRDPGNALGLWRTAKIARGLLRHPEREMRVLGCQTLVLMGRFQDECWSQLSPEDRAAWSNGGLIPAERLIQTNESHAMDLWEWAASANDVDQMRLLTAASHPRLRREYCRLFEQQFPNDHDNACPADQALPATIVTEAGDIPLVGSWPR